MNENKKIEMSVSWCAQHVEQIQANPHMDPMYKRQFLRFLYMSIIPNDKGALPPEPPTRPKNA